MKALLPATTTLCAFMLAMVGMTAYAAQTDSPDDASNYPQKRIRIIVPWGAGGDTDAIYRLVAEQMEDYLDTNVIISNISGGGGTIGAVQALHAKPDGYTLLAAHDSIAMSEAMGKAEFGPFDFEPVALMTSTYDTVATSPENPWDNMKDLIEDARKHPGKISYAASIGSTSQLEPIEIQAATGVEFNIVGNRDTASRMKAVVANDVDLGSVSVVAGEGYIKDGKLKLLGYFGEERNDAIPDVATLKEQGIDVTSATNRGVLVPKGTPKSIVKKLSKVLGRIAHSDKFQDKMKSFGTIVNYKDTEDYRDFLRRNQQKIGELVEKFDLNPNN